MPSRRRPKSPKLEPRDPIEQFAALLQESADREAAERDRLRNERQRARDAALAAEQHAAALAAARRALEHAIADAREARRVGRGIAATDEVWRQAKARLIELETGAPPAWARHDAPDVHEDKDSGGDSS